MKIVIAIAALAIIAAVAPKTDCGQLTKAECQYLEQVNAGMID